jgi:3-hydroxyisobutyrate dehydrogenase-like beta-hydroxyacid dehydrogenase
MTDDAPVASPERLSIGFVGLGVMGSAMACRLLAVGHDVSVYNRNPAKADALRAQGAKICGTPSEVASASDIVLGCLLDTDAVRSVYTGEGGLLGATRRGAVLVEHGTFDPAAAQHIAAAAREVGAEFLDVPVTGGPEGATAGTLTAMAGGAEEALERARPIIGTYAGRIEYVGGPGTGLALKLVNQLLVTCHLASAAEAAAMIRRLGLPPETADRVLGSGWAASAMLARTLPRADARDYESVGATIGGLLEVQRLVAALGERNGVTLTAFPAARSVFDLSVAAGHAGSDPAALVETYLTQPARPEPALAQ